MVVKILVAITVSVWSLGASASTSSSTEASVAGFSDDCNCAVLIHQNGVNRLEPIVLAAAAQGEPSQSKADRRFPVSRIAEYEKLYPGITEKIMKSAPSMAAITSVKDRDGKTKIGAVDYFGSAFLLGNSCHLVTTRHEVNKWELDKDGEWNPNDRIEPRRYKVEALIGYEPKGKRQAISGRVVFWGPSSSDPANDIALIRLDKKAPAKPLMTVVALKQVQQVAPGTLSYALSFPQDRQKKVAELELFVDPLCEVSHGNWNYERWVPTNCSGTAGESGGAHLSAVTPENSVLGFVSRGTEGLGSPGSSPKAHREASVALVSMAKWARDIIELIQDVPCN